MRERESVCVCVCVDVICVLCSPNLPVAAAQDLLLRHVVLGSLGNHLLRSLTGSMGEWQLAQKNTCKGTSSDCFSLAFQALHIGLSAKDLCHKSHQKDHPM